MKYFVLLISTFISFSVNAQDFELNILLLDEKRMIVDEVSHDLTNWLNSFPSEKHNGEIKYELPVSKGLTSTISYYRAAADQKKATLPGHRDFNIFDYKVTNKENEILCYNSIYVLSLKQMPYINIDCSTFEEDKYLNIKLNYSSHMFWREK